MDKRIKRWKENKILERRDQSQYKERFKSSLKYTVKMWVSGFLGEGARTYRMEVSMMRPGLLTSGVTRSPVVSRMICSCRSTSHDVSNVTCDCRSLCTTSIRTAT